MSLESYYLSFDPMHASKQSQWLLLCIWVGKDNEALSWSWRCPDTPASKRHVSLKSYYISFDPMHASKKSQIQLLCIWVGKDDETLSWS